MSNTLDNIIMQVRRLRSPTWAPSVVCSSMATTPLCYLRAGYMQLHMVSRGEPIMPVLNIRISIIGTEKHKV